MAEIRISAAEASSSRVFQLWFQVPCFTRRRKVRTRSTPHRRRRRPLASCPSKQVRLHSNSTTFSQHFQKKSKSQRGKCKGESKRKKWKVFLATPLLGTLAPPPPGHFQKRHTWQACVRLKPEIPWAEVDISKIEKMNFVEKIAGFFAKVKTIRLTRFQRQFSASETAADYLLLSRDLDFGAKVTCFISCIFHFTQLGLKSSISFSFGGVRIPTREMKK